MESDAQPPAAFRDPAPFSVTSNGLALTFLPGGPARLKGLLELIDNAQTTLDVVFFIFEKDRTAEQVRDALTQAARRGVEVRLILDDFGAVADPAFLAPLTDAGGEVLCFIPRWNVRYLIRNHQKFVIADGQRAMIGGFNIADAYFAPATQADGWSDLGLLLEGEAVTGLAEWFDLLEQWTARPDAPFRNIRRMVREWQPATGRLQWLVGGPVARENCWRRALVGDLDKARRVHLAIAYFSPYRRMIQRLARAARTGTARLVLAAKTDNPATIGAARKHYAALLKCGAQIYEFEPMRLHTKLIVIDDVSYIGSANLDMRSLYLNLELMLRIEDAALADRLREFIDAYIPASTEVTPQLHRQRGTWWNRIRWTLCWFLVTVVDYSVTRRLNLGL